MKTLRVAALVLTAEMSVATPSRAQDTLTGMVITGASDRGPVALVTGKLVQSLPSSSTEIVFSDGTSIVLGPGAAITVGSVVRNHGSGRWVLTGSSDRGALRILAADRMEVVLTTPEGDLRLAGTSAVVQSGPDGSATLLSAGALELRQNGRTDVLRRPGFRLAFANSSVERVPTPQLVTAIDPFAPVERPAGRVGQPPQQIGCPPEQNRKGERRAADRPNALCAGSKAAYVPSQYQTVTYNSNQAGGQSFALARAVLSQTATVNSNLAAPGPNSVPAEPAPPFFDPQAHVPPGSLGFANGVVQSNAGVPPSSQTSFYAISSTRPDDLHIASSPPVFDDAGTSFPKFSVTFGFQPTAVGNLSFDVGAAPAPNRATGQKSLHFDNAPSPFFSPMPRSNEHLVWGQFLADLAVQAPGQSDFVGMGFWVAGRLMSLQALQSLTGTANYTGDMEGTVVRQGQRQLRTVTGQFAEQWNFANRSGNMNVDFDGGTWNGIGVVMPVGRTDFGGAGVSNNGRTMTVQGAFFHNAPVVQTPATLVSAPNTPAAVGGQFGIRGVDYGANGIFVGGRR